MEERQDTRVLRAVEQMKRIKAVLAGIAPELTLAERIQLLVDMRRNAPRPIRRPHQA